MPKLLLLLSCWFIASGSICQSPTATFFDTPTITETSVGKARIGLPVAKLKELYKGCSFSPAYLYKYGFEAGNNHSDAILISRGGQKLFLYYADSKTKKIAGLIVLSPIYKTAKGIHVGSTSKQLKAATPTAQVRPHENDEYMEIASAGPSEKSDLVYVFYKQGSIRKNKDSDEPVEVTASNATISWIQVYDHR